VEEEEFQYEVWTDVDRTLALTYGAATSADARRPLRITVLLDENGDLLLSYEDVRVGTNPNELLEDCEALFPAP
jgi:peroxiredoxin